MKIKSLDELFVDELKDAYDFEHQLLDALPKMAESAHDPELRKAFERHRAQTERQVKRLEQVFQRLGERPSRKTCKGMKGLIKEGQKFVKARGDEAAVDAALVGAAQRVEHYEMAAYGTLRAFAQTLGRHEEAKILQQILEEEARTDENLTRLAESRVNPRAANGAAQVQGRATRSSRRSGNGGTRRSRTRVTSAASAIGKQVTAGTPGRSASTGTTGGRRAGGTKLKGRSTAGTTGHRASSRSGGNGEITRDQLYEQARRLDIEGRSSMNKRQLERAVQKGR